MMRGTFYIERIDLRPAEGPNPNIGRGVRTIDRPTDVGFRDEMTREYATLIANGTIELSFGPIGTPWSELR